MQATDLTIAYRNDLISKVHEGNFEENNVMWGEFSIVLIATCNITKINDEEGWRKFHYSVMQLLILLHCMHKYAVMKLLLLQNLNMQIS